MAERIHGSPRGHGGLRTGVHAGQAVSADGGNIHAFNLRPVLVGAGGDHQVVVANALPTCGDHGVGRGVEFGHHLLDPRHACGVVIGVLPNDLVDRPDACGDQGVARLVVVDFLGVNQGDFGATEQLAQAIGQSNPPKAATRNHDVRLRCDGLRAAVLGLQAQCHRGAGAGGA